MKKKRKIFWVVGNQSGKSNLRKVAAPKSIGAARNGKGIKLVVN